MTQKLFLFLVGCVLSMPCYCWGFFGHQRINNLAVFLLPPEMMVFFKPNIQFITEHAVDPDKRRYAVKDEAPKHFIDIDNYGKYPYESLPRDYDAAIKKFGKDSVIANGIVPWWIQVMQQRLTVAFREKNAARILRYAAEIGHYIADSHVPLHASSNHDGQLSNQKGIHAFWESRVPELLADKEFDFMIGKATYVKDIPGYVWKRVLESAASADTVLRYEAELTKQYPGDKKYAFEPRNGVVVRQYSSQFTLAYNNMLNGMVERRMRMSIASVANFWYTAWINAGQPDLKGLKSTAFSAEDVKEFEALNDAWRSSSIQGRPHEN